MKHLFVFALLAGTFISGAQEPFRFHTKRTKDVHVVEKSFEIEKICDEGDRIIRLRIAAAYPQLRPVTKTTAAVNRLIEESVFESVGLDDAADCAPVLAERGSGARTVSSDEECQVTKRSAAILSIRCRGSWDGGAHPDAGLRALNIALRTNSILATEDLFIEGAQPRLRQMVRRHFKNLGPSRTGRSMTG